jgi:hypothetical protein
MLKFITLLGLVLAFNAMSRDFACSEIEGKQNIFIQVDTKKYPKEELVLSLPQNKSDCSLVYNPKISIYWKYKTNRKLCNTANSFLKSLLTPSSIRKISNHIYDLSIDVLESATDDTKSPMGSIVRVIGFRKNGKCSLRTEVYVQNQKMELHSVYAGRIAVSLFGSVNVRSGHILGLQNKKRMRFEF